MTCVTQLGSWVPLPSLIADGGSADGGGAAVPFAEGSFGLPRP